MAKLTLSDVSNLTGAESAAIATINANWDAIIAALENTLSRDGTTPNQMSADLDLNSNDILNGGAAAFTSLSIGGVAFSPAALDDITDVTITSVSDGEFLRYDSGSSRWINNTHSEADLLVKSSNLSDIPSASSARTNLGATTVGNAMFTAVDEAAGRTAIGLTTPTGYGDMLLSVYDPTSVSGDAFDMDNMAEGTNNKIMTATERTRLGITPVYVATRTALKALSTSTYTKVWLTESGREGLFIFQSGDYSTEATADTQEGVYVVATDTASSSGAWVREYATGEFLASWFGFSTAASAANNTTYLNAAITLANSLGTGVIKIAPGSFAVNTILMRANVTLQGAGRASTTLADSRADANSVITSQDNSASILWVRVLDLKVTKSNATGGTVIDCTSWQLYEIGRCWITSASILGTECIRMRGLFTGTVAGGNISFSTDGTYGHIHNNYIGLCAFGIRVGVNANSCWIHRNRIQPSVTGGAGIYVGESGAAEGPQDGFPNQVVLDSNSIEFPPGSVSGMSGVFILAEVDRVTISNTRFEGGGLSYGIYAEAGARGIAHGNYYSGMASSNIVGLSTAFSSLDGTTSGYVVPSAKIAISGTDGSLKGVAHNISGSRSSTGVYAFTFTNSMADANYTITTAIVSSSTGATARVSVKTSSGFTVTTEASGGVADVLEVNCVVYP